MTECIEELITNINQTILDLFDSDTPNCADERYVDSICEYIQTAFTDIYPDKLLYHEFVTQQVYLMAEQHLAGSGFYDSEYTFKETPSSLTKLQHQVKYLETVPQPAQRTPEWYAYREQRLTASDIASVFNKNPFGTYRDLLAKKGLPADPNDDTWKSMAVNPFIVHGVKYEPVATWFYEYLKDTTITEFGCLPHEDIPFLGASPDGISKDGVMLEIKCPFSRPIYGVPPIYYWYQMQLQLEVAKLNQCDFLECDIKEKTEADWDTLVKDNSYTTSHYVGVVVEVFNTESESTDYEYFPYGSNLSGVPEWETEVIDRVLSSDNLEYRATHRWHINKYACTGIYRDNRWFNRNLPQLSEFWQQVLQVRQVGALPEPDTPARKPSGPRATAPVICMIDDSDSDETTAKAPRPPTVGVKATRGIKTSKQKYSKPKVECLIMDSDSD
jgi:putative phage-type endonuclease